MDETTAWKAVIAESLAIALKQKEGPVPGARFKPTFARVAKEKGLQFPPASEPFVKFVDFLCRFPDILAIQRRPHQDILIAPAGKSELFTTASEPTYVRKDLFDGFTMVTTTHHRPLYKPSVDRVVWVPSDKVPTDESIPLPPVTVDDQIEVRRLFAEEIGDLAVQAALFEALKAEKPFAAFSVVVHSSQLSRRWQAFRTRAVLQAVQKWAADNKLSWREAWLASTPGTLRDARRSDGSSSDSTALAEALKTLSDTELSRISVPLDIVARLLRRGD